MRASLTIHISNFSNSRETVRNTKEYFGHVDATKTADNVVLVDRDREKVAKKLFGDFVEGHDKRERHLNRKYGSVQGFLDSQFKSNQKRSKNWNGRGDRDLCQAIVQIGSGSDDLDRAKLKSILEKAGKDLCLIFGQRVVSAAVHMDESAPHLQIDFYPSFTDKRGSMKNASSGMFRELMSEDNSRQAFKSFRKGMEGLMVKLVKGNYSELHLARSKKLRQEKIEKQLADLQHEIVQLKLAGQDVEPQRQRWKEIRDSLSR